MDDATQPAQGDSPAGGADTLETAGDSQACRTAVRIGTQILVFRSEDHWGPYCTAANSRGKRCSTSLLYLDCKGWSEVTIPGTDGYVNVPDTGEIDEECWIRQRCPKHLYESRGAVAAEWTFFDPERDAGIVGSARPVWTPQGVVDPAPPSLADQGGADSLPDAVAHAPANDEQAALLARARAASAGPEGPMALYRYWDEKDRLLYIGITDDLLGRTRAHVLGSSWMDYAARSTITRYPSRDEALEAEEAAIKAEQPMFNDVHNRTPEAKLRLVEFLIEHGRADLLAPSVSRG